MTKKIIEHKTAHKTALVRIFLERSKRAQFKALCAKEETSMQAALEDYIRDCVDQGKLL
jgi:hypothetical protein